MKGSHITPEDIKELYTQFDAPITVLDCGKKCAPYNEGGKPFCCDICVAVPTVYQEEWDYLNTHTDLWFVWKAENCTDTREEAAKEVSRLKEETPGSMVLVECLGPSLCQRSYRGLTCRQFPFFPYIDSQGNFLGLSYYWEYEEQCWVISNLEVVTEDYQRQFLAAFETIFRWMPGEFENYRYHSEVMRDTFNEQRRAIPLLHRNGYAYKITTHNERMRRVPVDSLPTFGPYRIAAKMPFPDEIS